ncbi:hypothetical protein B0H11DRAFT_1915549 [Mycena galericulata]|nr:hypothetical protein B0H11DRAFT_1915549 [Mycena galericulata]
MGGGGGGGIAGHATGDMAVGFTSDPSHQLLYCEAQIKCNGASTCKFLDPSSLPTVNDLRSINQQCGSSGIMSAMQMKGKLLLHQVLSPALEHIWLAYVSGSIVLNGGSNAHESFEWSTPAGMVL